MAADPRVEPVTEYICAQFGVTAEDAELPTLAILGEVDAHDSLRAMLRPEVEDAAVEVIARTITDRDFGDGAWDRIHDGWKGPPRRQARALLHVIRGVASHG